MDPHVVGAVVFISGKPGPKGGFTGFQVKQKAGGSHVGSNGYLPVEIA
jgi:hypothetical protein